VPRAAGAHAAARRLRRHPAGLRRQEAREGHPSGARPRLLGLGEQAPPHPRRRRRRIVAKPECEPQRHIREFRLEGPTEIKVGALLKADEVFAKVKKTVTASDGKQRDVEVYPDVDVIGTTKGRGFTGVVKRHNFGGLRGSHGVKKGNRQHGSIASNASNRGSGRPKKGIRMAGQYGHERVTVRNLTVVRIDPENNLMLVKGAIPGPNGGLVMVRPTNKRG